MTVAWQTSTRNKIQSVANGIVYFHHHLYTTKNRSHGHTARNHLMVIFPYFFLLSGFYGFFPSLHFSTSQARDGCCLFIYYVALVVVVDARSVGSGGIIIIIRYRPSPPPLSMLCVCKGSNLPKLLFNVASYCSPGWSRVHVDPR